MLVAELFFFFSLYVLFFSLGGYPLIVYIIAAVRGNSKREYVAQDYPSVTFTFACCWEGERLQSKIENCQNIDYPPPYEI